MARRDPDTDPRAFLGRELRYGRVAGGFSSQEALAARLDFDRTVIAKAETGDRPPTAVVASTDRSAVGLLDALARRGLPVPGAVSVVGYDDSLLARLAHVDLTTVSQNARQQAEQAVALAVDRLENSRPTTREIVLAPRLVVRSTTAPPRIDGAAD